MSEPTFIQEQLEAREAKNKWKTRAWVFGILMIAAIVAAGITSYLYLYGSRNQLAANSDAQRQQFITCQDLPKTDARCQQPVAPPAKEIIKEGPQGIPGIQGIPGPQGIQGPQGRQGPQGPPGSAGKNGVTPPCQLLLGGCQGAEGKQGPNGPEGAQGPEGKAGKDGESCLPTNPDCRGPKGDQGDKGDKGDQGEKGAPGPIGPPGRGIQSITCPDDNDPLTADPFEIIYTDGTDEVVTGSICRPGTA